MVLTPPIQPPLVHALEFIEDDEPVEETPHHLCLRKRYLRENVRKRAPIVLPADSSPRLQ